MHNSPNVPLGVDLFGRMMKVAELFTAETLSAQRIHRDFMRIHCVGAVREPPWSGQRSLDPGRL
jgi:hypothetical protein